MLHCLARYRHDGILVLQWRVIHHQCEPIRREHVDDQRFRDHVENGGLDRGQSAQDIREDREKWARARKTQWKGRED